MGEPYLFRRPDLPHILNIPTKQHWRSSSRLEGIVAGVRFLQARYGEWGVTSFAVPALGCGLGQLDWATIGPTLTRLIQEFSIPVTLFAPGDV